MTQLLSVSLLVLLAWRETAWSLGSRVTVPTLLELFAFGVIGVGFFRGLRRKERGPRLAIAGTAGAFLLYTGVRAVELYFEIHPGFLASRRAALLSSVSLGLPLVGIFSLLLLFVFSLGLYEMLRESLGPRWLPVRSVGVLRAALCLAFLGFGLLALFGYGSGSPWLFLT